MSGTRPQIARTIEKSLGQIAVTRFDAPGPIQYAKGTSVLVFGEFAGTMSHQQNHPAVMLAVTDYSRKERGSVAVCLFGSMDNFPEYIQARGPVVDWGWAASAAPNVFNFINSQGRDLNLRGLYSHPSETKMALAALQIAYSQGTYRPSWECTYGLDRPWLRAYTYGDSQKAEWLAQIYLDKTREDFESEDIPIEEYADGAPVRRVLVGAPLWIRTPSPRAVQIYADCDDLDMSPADRSTRETLGSASTSRVRKIFSKDKRI